MARSFCEPASWPAAQGSVRHHQVDTFTCANCGKEFPSANGLNLRIRDQIGIFVLTIGGIVAGRMCRDCRAGMDGAWFIAMLVGVMVLIFVGAKWLG